MKKLRVLLLLVLLVGTFPLQVLAQEEEEPVLVCGLELDEGPELAEEVGYGLLVKATEGEELELRAGTSSSSQVILETNDLTILEVTGGPTRVGRTSWWEVVTTSGEEGWIAEGGNIAVGTVLSTTVVSFSDGWCALRPVRVAQMMLLPGELFGAFAWGVEFDFAVEDLPEGGVLTFLDGEVVPASEVNLTAEPKVGEDTTIFRINIRFFASQRTLNWRTSQFWFIYDGEPEELAEVD